MASRRALVKQRIADLEQRVAELQEAAVSHSRCHRALLLRDSLLTAWCDGLSMLHDHMLSAGNASGGDTSAALAELLQQERELMQELRTCSKGLPTRHKLSELQGAARVRTIAPASDPMALFFQHVTMALAPGAVQLSSTTELARLLRSITLEISISVHMLDHLPPSAHDPVLRRLAALWERYLQALTSAALTCKTDVVEGVLFTNLETMQLDLEGAREQDQRTADLVPKLQLSEYQMDLFHAGITLYDRLVAHVQRERQLLQAHPIGATEVAAAGDGSASSSTAPTASAASEPQAAAAGASAGSAPAPAITQAGDTASGRDSSSGAHNSSSSAAAAHDTPPPSSRVVVESMSEWEEHQAVVQAHLARLNVCLQKEYMLKTIVSGWFLGALSFEQLSRACVLSYPFMFRPLWLAKHIHKLGQELDGQGQQQVDAQKAAG